MIDDRSASFVALTAAAAVTTWSDRKLNKDTDVEIVGLIGGGDEDDRLRHQSHWWGDGGNSDGSATVELKRKLEREEKRRICVN